MKKFKIILTLLITGLVLSSCGKSYLYEKEIVNNSREAIQVQSLYEFDNSIHTIEPGERKVVFVCTYQSFKKPDKNSVSNKFTILNQSPEKEAHIKNSANWNVSENGKNIKNIYIFED